MTRPTDAGAGDAPVATVGARPALAVQDLSVVVTAATGDVPIVTGVTFDVDPGSTLAVVGESGCGKSTLALALLGLTDPVTTRMSASRLEVAGRDMSAASLRQWRSVRGSSIGMVSQEPMSSLDPAFRVGAQIAEVVRRHNDCSRQEARARAREVLALVKINDVERRARQYPHELSGGMLQRAAIAMALASEPDVLVLDEPTTALDVSTQASLLRLLDGLRERLGTAIVIITHDLAVVADVAEDVLVMYAGETVEHGRVRDVFERPAHPYTAGLLQSLPTTHYEERRLRYIPGAPPAPGSNVPGCRFHPRCDFAVHGRCDDGPIPLMEGGSIDPAAGEHAGERQHRCVRSREISLPGVV